MSLSRKGNSITMTDVNDAYTGILNIVGITFQGSTLSIGDRILLTDTDGSILADYLVSQATENVDLWAGRQAQFCQGAKFGAVTIAGGWVLTIFTD